MFINEKKIIQLKKDSKLNSQWRLIFLHMSSPNSVFHHCLYYVSLSMIVQLNIYLNQYIIRRWGGEQAKILQFHHNFLIHLTWIIPYLCFHHMNNSGYPVTINNTKNSKAGKIQPNLEERERWKKYFFCYLFVWC